MDNSIYDYDIYQFRSIIIHCYQKQTFPFNIVEVIKVICSSTYDFLLTYILMEGIFIQYQQKAWLVVDEQPHENSSPYDYKGQFRQQRSSKI